MSKYDSPRDEILDMMVKNGWGNKSSGNVESPSGWFAIVTNTMADHTSLEDAFGNERRELGVPFSDIVGSFVVVENSQGFVTVHDFESEHAAEIVYAECADEYAMWISDNDPDNA